MSDLPEPDPEFLKELVMLCDKHVSADTDPFAISTALLYMARAFTKKLVEISNDHSARR